MGNISLQLLIARELIARLDAAQDFRPLSASEAWLRGNLKRSYLGLTSLECSILHQRVRFTWLREGEMNRAFYKIHEAYRQKKNRIFALKVGESSITDKAAMAEAAFHHFTSMIGTSRDRLLSIDLTRIDRPTPLRPR